MLDQNIKNIELENRVNLSWGLMFQCVGESAKATSIYTKLKANFEFHCSAHLYLNQIFASAGRTPLNIPIAGENQKELMIVDLLKAVDAALSNNYRVKKFSCIK